MLQAESLPKKSMFFSHNVSQKGLSETRQGSENREVGGDNSMFWAGSRCTCFSSGSFFFFFLLILFLFPSYQNPFLEYSLLSSIYPFGTSLSSVWMLQSYSQHVSVPVKCKGLSDSCPVITRLPGLTHLWSWDKSIALMPASHPG